MASILITSVRPYGEDPTDIAIAGGRIVESVSDPDVTIDGSGLVALPGLVDMHTHLREPGKEDAETVLTGSQAAARGGYTAVHAMANTQPVQDNAGVVEHVWNLGRTSGYTEVIPIGAVTLGQRGEVLAELAAMAHSAAGVRIFSDDGVCVHDPLLMRRALEYVKAFDGIIAQHAQDPRLTAGAQMNEGVVSAQLGLPGWPAVAEEAIVARDILLAEHVGSRLHVCHLSTKGSVELVRWAKSRGVNVTAEVTPHHLMLTDELVRSYDPVYKVNPPLRTQADVDAVRAGLADGTIDVVGTDHAPHTAEHKCAEWTAAAMGMVGLESALAIVREAMADYDFGFRELARVMSTAPAEIAGLDNHGSLEVGHAANLVLINPDATVTINPNTHATKGRNNPFAGFEVNTEVVHTILYGAHVVKDGQLSEPHSISRGAHTWID